MLKAQKLEHTQVNCGVQSETTLIRTKGGIELDSISSVDLWLEVVVFPDNTELDDALWDCDDLKGGLVFGVFLEEGGVLESGG